MFYFIDQNVLLLSFYLSNTRIYHPQKHRASAASQLQGLCYLPNHMPADLLPSVSEWLSLQLSTAT